jgi:ribosomal protein S19E (S16A)
LYQKCYESSVALESIEQTFNGSVDFGRKVSCTVSRNGDLIHKVYLQVDLPALASADSTGRWVDNIGHVLIDEVSVEIGGQTINFFEFTGSLVTCG